jgi:hypothetical protein
MSLVTDTIQATSHINEALGATIASATTPNINDATGNTVFISGTTTITGFSTADQAGISRRLIFNDAVLLTHSSDLKLFGDANITTVAGDVAIFTAESTTVWRMTGFYRASGFTGGQFDSDAILNGAIIAAKIGDAAVIPSKLRVKTVTALTDANATLTNEQMLGGVLTITPTANRDLTTATGTNICTLLTGYQTGTSFEFTVVCLAAFNARLVAGVGVTIVGDDTINNESGTWLAVVTGTNTVSIYKK